MINRIIFDIISSLEFYLRLNEMILEKNKNQ